MTRHHLHIHPPADGERSRPGSQEYFISFSHMAKPQVYLGRAAHACRAGNVPATCARFAVPEHHPHAHESFIRQTIGGRSDLRVNPLQKNN